MEVALVSSRVKKKQEKVEKRMIYKYYVIIQVMKSVVERATISLINTITVLMNEHTTAPPTCIYFGGWVVFVGRLIRIIITITMWRRFSTLKG